MGSHLYVVTTVFNFTSYTRRYALYRDFAQRICAQGADLYTLEISYDHRPFVVTEAGNDHHIQLHTNSAFFYKENASNVAVSYLPHDWEYVAFVDCDVHFTNDHWIRDALAALQTCAVIQPFSCTLELNYDCIPYQFARGSAWLHCHHYQASVGADLLPGKRIMPGAAYCFRRDEFERVGGLPEFEIVGGGDTVFMSAILKNKPYSHGYRSISKGFSQWVKNYTVRAYPIFANKVGYVDGLLLFYWHGSKIKRAYNARFRVLSAHAFDPYTDLKKNADGLYEIVNDTPRQRQLQRDLLKQFYARDDESTEDDPQDNNLKGLIFGSQGGEEDETSVP